MPLSARQNEDLFDALLDAFNPASFDNMLFLKLKKNRSWIAGDGDFPTIVRKVIQAANNEDWEQSLVCAAVKANGDNQKLKSFVETYKIDCPPDPTSSESSLIYSHILFILSAPLETTQGAGDTTSSQKATPPESATSSSQLFNLIKAEAPTTQGGDEGELKFHLKEGGVVVTTFAGAEVLLKFAFHIARTIKSLRGERLRMGIHCAASIAEKTGEQPTEPPPKGIYIARRLVELGSAGHILATYESGEVLKRDIDFESVFNNKFDALFHVARNRELWPRESVDVYNVYLTTHDGDGRLTTLGNEQPPKTRVPERVMSSIEVPRTLKELRGEKINITFWPDLPYVSVKFQFEDKKESNITVSSELPECEECTYECDFENHNYERKQVFDIELINKAKNRLVVLKLLCLDRYDKEIQDFARPIRLRRYFPLYWWDRFWFSRWYFKVALVLLACLIGYAGYRGYRYLTRPVVIREEPEPRVVTEMPSVFFSEREELLRWQWDFSGQSIKLDTGTGGEPNKALVVTGPQRLLINPTSLKGKTFKDFVVFLTVQLRLGSTRAGWIFRASPDKKKGYIFILERQLNGQFLLHGTFDEGDGSPLQDDKLGFRQVAINTCRDDDWINIKATVNENTFSHTAWIKSRDSDCTGKEQPITPDFVDEKGRFPFGNVGIFVPKDNEVLVDHWVMGKYKP